MISIITPTLNSERYLEECIDSVYSQGVPVQHIIVDGGSTDKTKEIAFRHPCTFITKKGSTQTEAINIGLKLASGQILGWLNSDDIYEPEALRIVMEFFSKNPQADLVYSDCWSIDEKGKLAGMWDTNEFSRFRNLNYFQMIPQPTSFFRASVLRNIGYLSEKYNYAFDYDFYVRVAKDYSHEPDYYMKAAKAFNIMRIPGEPLACFRLHSESKTKSHAEKFEPEIREIKKEHGATIPHWMAKGLNRAIGLYKRRL